MLGRLALILFAGALLIAWVAPAACADQTIDLNSQFQMVGKNIIAHIIALNISDTPMQNVYYPDIPNTTFVRLIYTFENIGDRQDKGYIKPVFIDAGGNQYQNFDYTGESVLPHTTAGPFFIEVPVPKGTTIVRITFIEGFDTHTFDVPRATPTTAPKPTGDPSVTSKPYGTPMPPGGYGWRECLPLIPFAMAGGIAGVGVVINRCGIRKR